MKAVVFEDDSAAGFLPLVCLRPVFELLCGAFTLRQKVQELFPDSELHLEVRPELAEVAADAFGTGALNNPERLVPDDDVLLVSAAAILTGLPESYLEQQQAAATADGAFIWAFLRADTVAEMAADSARQLAAGALDRFGTGEGEDLLVRSPWDLVHHNADQIARDWQTAYAARTGAEPGPGVAVLGSEDDLFVADDAQVEPCALLDCREGPVIVEAGAVVHAHATVEGPAFVGPGAHVRDAHLGPGSSLGERCDVGGRVLHSILHGHCVQTGAGYVGHSYLGEWTQVGPSAALCDRKSDFSSTSIPPDGAEARTERVRLGALVGDHTRIGAGVVLNPGSVVGVACNLVAGDGPMPRRIPSFCWHLAGRATKGVGITYALQSCRAAVSQQGGKLTEAMAEMLRRTERATRPERLAAARRARRRAVGAAAAERERAPDRSKVLAGVRAALTRLLGVAPEEMTPEARLAEDLGADSVQVVQLTAELEQQFDLDLDEGAALGMGTVDDAVELVMDALSAADEQ